MATAFIFNQSLSANDQTLIESVLQKAGFKPVYGTPAEVANVDAAVDIGVIGLPIEAQDIPAVNKAAQLFGGAGIRVIGIWLHKDAGSVMPEGLEKFGSSVIGIESVELPDALAGKTDVWEQPAGSPRTDPRTKRNKC